MGREPIYDDDDGGGGGGSGKRTTERTHLSGSGDIGILFLIEQAAARRVLLLKIDVDMEVKSE
jgi:hypothetical protein